MGVLQLCLPASRSSCLGRAGLRQALPACIVMCRGKENGRQHRWRWAPAPLRPSGRLADSTPPPRPVRPPRMHRQRLRGAVRAAADGGGRRPAVCAVPLTGGAGRGAVCERGVPPARPPGACAARGGGAERGAVGGWRRRISPAAAAAAREPGPVAAAARGCGGGRGALSARWGAGLRAGEPLPRPVCARGERRRAGSRGGGGHGQRGEPGRRRRAGRLPRRGGGGRGWRRLRGPLAEPGPGRGGGGPEPAERGGEEADRRCHVKGAGAAQREPRRRGAASHAKARTENLPSPGPPFPPSPSPRGGAGGESQYGLGPLHREQTLHFAG